MKKLMIVLLLTLVAVMGSPAALVGHWTFDETALSVDFTGDRLDSGPNSLTLANLSGTYTRGAAGLDGNAMVSRRDPAFPNAGHYTSSLRNDSALLKLTDSFSFSIFVDPFVNDTKVTILGVNGSYGLELVGGATPTFNWYVLNAGSGVGVGSATIPAEGWNGDASIRGDDLNNDVHWYHLVGSYDAVSGELGLYVDGTKSTATLTGAGAPKTSADPFNVGQMTAGVVPGMLGLYDDLQLYNQVLTDEQVNFLGANPGSVVVVDAIKLSFSSSNGMHYVCSTNLPVWGVNYFQVSSDLTTGVWSNLSYVSGVTTTSWPATMVESKEFFRVVNRDPRPDVLFADFEGASYGQWTAEGTAFGTAPAQGTLPGQQAVTGYLGSGLVNSFFEGDAATGTLTSPEFTIDRNFIKFLIGGGGYAGETCINLIVDGVVVRTATGPNTSSGGSEALDWAGWDVSGLYGRVAVIEIVDSATGGWGHINIDNIVQSDIPPPPAPVEITRSLNIDAGFLQLPLMQRANARQSGVERFTIENQAGEVLRFMHLEFAEPGQEPDFWYSADVREFLGQDVVFRFTSMDPEVLDGLVLSDEEIIDPQAYTGPNRPRFHFSPRIGWMNDINGTYYQDGRYHLFYQYNPTTAGTSTGFDMHWGHSVSTNLVHWEEWPVALFPDKDDQVYSGTALLIDQTIAGINDSAPKPTPALFFTATGNPISQHMATTLDGGQTWQRFSGNPVVPFSSGGNRDPKVFWHEPSTNYVMFLYETSPVDGYSVRRSTNLTDWEQVSFLPGWYECPEFLPFTSPTTGEELWVLYGYRNGPQPFGGENFSAPSAYQLGTFDGMTFTPTTNVRAANSGPNFYAAITFVNEPENRHVMMGWVRGPSFPGEPFNQCASVPLNLTLKDLGGVDTLSMEPVDELEALRGAPLVSLQNISITAANSALATLSNEALLDVVMRVRPTSNAALSATYLQHQFVFDPSTSVLSYTQYSSLQSRKELHPGDSIPIRFLIDRSMIDSFWNGGEVSYSIRSETGGSALVLDGDAVVEELTVWPVSDIWE